MLGWIACATAMLVAGPVDGVNVSARIEAEVFEVGQSYRVAVSFDLPAGWSAKEAGVPAPLVQFQPPDSVQLAGKVLESHEDLSRNEFLQAPFEKLLRKNPHSFKFKLIADPKSDDRFHINVLAYVSDADGQAHFIRRRLELPLSPGSESTAIADAPSDWGQDATLQLGDKAAPFDLPQADGATVSLNQFLGKKNIIVTTYRAFW